MFNVGCLMSDVGCLIKMYLMIELDFAPRPVAPRLFSPQLVYFNNLVNALQLKLSCIKNRPFNTGCFISINSFNHAAQTGSDSAGHGVFE